MAYLGKARKEDLKNLAIEMGIAVKLDSKVIEIKDLILKSASYDEEFVKNLLETIKATRIEEEERQEKLRKEEEERQEKLRKEELEREDRKRKDEINFELEKLKLEKLNQSTETPESGSTSVKKNSCELKKLMQPFDVKMDDISLYLVLFERQARRAEVAEEHWVSYLIGLLPTDIAQIIAREPESKADDYNHIKSVLLKRFKLSAEKFRIKFVTHHKRPGSSWQDFVFELRNYFEEWLKGLNIDTFEQLKDLMISDQLKKRVEYEVREHFIDKWAKLCSSTEIAEMLEEYDNVRSVSNKKQGNHSHENKFKGKFKTQAEQDKKEKLTANSHPKFSKRNEEFEVRKKTRCYECNSFDHLRPQCPKLKKSKENFASINRISGYVDEDFLSPYTMLGKVNGIDMPILRDSGATIDIVCRKVITPEMLTGEHIWVQQPLDEAPICLPLAEVHLEGDFGNIITKAAVVRKELDKGRYLLGNRTAAMLRERGDTFQVNAVQTRSQKANLEYLEAQDNENSTTKPNEAIIEKNEDESESELLPQVEYSEPLSLLQVDAKCLASKQREEDEFKALYDFAQKGNNENPSSDFQLTKNGLLVKRKTDKTGEERYLLLIPKLYREQIKSLCHDGTSGHLGITKTKDVFSKYFFWPNCFRELEEYVRSCDSCQRVGKPNDKKKAPLKLVPVIQEIFTKINIDACGPLPVTPSGNRYLITAICLASKYPDAVPVNDISSSSVVDALMQIFSRLGFPKIVQCDQGSSFMSELTTTFLEKFGIKMINSSVHHPQSNPVERFHRTVKRILRVLCLEAGPDWEKHIYPALFALRTVTHESTGFSPAELVHGKNLRSPVTLMYEHLMDIEEHETPVTKYIFDLMNRMRRCQELAVNKMEEVQVKRKTWYDRNAVKREYQEGDLVLILSTSKANKLVPNWIGPGTILNKLSETNYVVELPGNKGKSQVYHVNMLKKYFKRPEQVNYLIKEDNDPDKIDSELELPYIDSLPSILDFDEVIQINELDSKLNPDELNQLKCLIFRYEKCFTNIPGKTDIVVHDIELIDDKQILSKPYRTSPRQNEILKTEIQKMLAMKVIEVGVSDYTSPMILVEAPCRDPRPCIDYRRLNKITRTKFYPLPNIEDRVERVSSAKFITLLDLSKGSWQILLSTNAQRLAAFVTSLGTFKPLRMSFELKNAPYEFSKMMSTLLEGCENFAIPYLDDVAIFSDSFSNHLKHLETVLSRIKRANLTIKPSKCKFAKSSVKYLGHIVGQGCRKPSDVKVQAVLDFPKPTTKTGIRTFLGLAGYYSRYIPMYSSIASPLTDALKGKNKKGSISWNESCEQAFNQLKASLSNSPVLYAPDFKKNFIVQTDASDNGIGVVLSQTDDKGSDHPILYLSRKFTKAEKNYSTTEKECAAIIYAVKKLDCYLNGQTFIIQTDHNPLVWLQKNSSSNARLMRWALILQPYDFQIEHRAGKLNGNADSLSRSVVTESNNSVP